MASIRSRATHYRRSIDRIETHFTDGPKKQVSLSRKNELLEKWESWGRFVSNAVAANITDEGPPE